MDILFSIIIPLYNKEDYIIDTLNSLIKQSYRKFEIIIIDDYSEDDSYSKVCEFISENKELTIILERNEKNRGVSYSRNKGIEMSKGNFFIFLDADDIFTESNFLHIISSYIKKYKAEYIVLTRNYYDKYHKPKIKSNTKYLLELEEDFYKITDGEKFSLSTNFPFGGSSSAVISRSQLHEKKFDVCEKRFEDWLFFFDIFINSEPFYCKKSFVKINYVEGSLSRGNNSDFRWRLPKFYHYLDDNNFIKHRKRFFWIWMVGKLRSNIPSRLCYDNLKQFKKEIFININLNKYFLYSMFKIGTKIIGFR